MDGVAAGLRSNIIWTPVGTRAVELDHRVGPGCGGPASSGHDVERSGEPIAAGLREDASLLPERIAVVER